MRKSYKNSYLYFDEKNTEQKDAYNILNIAAKSKLASSFVSRLITDFIYTHLDKKPSICTPEELEHLIHDYVNNEIDISYYGSSVAGMKEESIDKLAAMLAARLGPAGTQHLSSDGVTAVKSISAANIEEAEKKTGLIQTDETFNTDETDDDEFIPADLSAISDFVDYK